MVTYVQESEFQPWHDPLILTGPALSLNGDNIQGDFNLQQVTKQRSALSIQVGRSFPQ